MNAGKYTVKDFFVNRYLKQVITPEIQRDYVWQAEQLHGLLTSLLSDFQRFTEPGPKVQADDPELVAAFAAYQRRRTRAANLGFIYAYSDDDFAGRYFLIDGQQRITSVFLMLLALAHCRPELREPFHRIFYDEGRLKLDYNVREASHDFLVRLVPYLLKDSAATGEKIEEQAWYYSAAGLDATIRNLTQNFRLLQNRFAAADFQQVPLLQATTTASAATTPEAAFFEYLTEYTEFYYFDTNISEQGEDLYIYMNARGEQMQSNENIKADLLGRFHTPQEKNEWGAKWEAWQDFFWQHRASGKSKNQNADAGFNGFLACIAGLTNLVIGKSPAEQQADGTSKTSRILAALDLPTIEQYIGCLQFLHDEKEKFKEDYAYSEWVGQCLDEIWGIINNGEKTDWYANYNDGNRGNERRQMAYIWPVLRFMVKHNGGATLSVSDTFRVLRMHYLRFHNNYRSVAGLEMEADERLRLGISNTSRTDEEKGEEKLKQALYAAVASDQVRRYEELIWEIEDHKFNLDGSDVGGTNITHLVDFKPVPSLDYLKKVRDSFYELFPPGKNGNYALQNVLLYYGPYQHRESPWYYYNYNFGDWKRTIRGKGSEEAGSPEKENAFRRFFTDFLREEVTVDGFLQKYNTAISKEEAVKHHQMVLWYSQIIPEKMWHKGTYIAFSDNWDGNDTFFPKCRVIYNTRGDFRGSYNRKLQDLMPLVTAE